MWLIDWVTDPAAWASFATLAALEIVLGIDNLIFISIVAGRLPPEQRDRARVTGLSLALLMRLALLASIAWIVGLTAPVFTLFDHPVSWRDLILVGGGLFLLAKGTIEIHHQMEEAGQEGKKAMQYAGFAGVIAQILFLDVIFSLDSVITAVGMSDDLGVMILAVVAAMAVMLFASGPVSAFVQRHPTVKMLALSFLLLIGIALVADGAGFHIPKGYLYFAIAFSVLVEALNLFARRKRKGAAAPAGESQTVH